MMLEDRIKEKIGHNIASDEVVLFMKGTCFPAMRLFRSGGRRPQPSGH